MKRGGKEFVFAFSLVFILSIGIASAGFFGDFFDAFQEPSLSPTLRDATNVQEFDDGGIIGDGGLSGGDSCFDSDGGADPLVKGTVTGFNSSTNSNYSLSDYCSDISGVAEYTCVGAGFMLNVIPCPSGHSCSDGACVPDSGNACTDSDGGNNLFVKGTTSNETVTATDFCLNTEFIGEYVCSQDPNSNDVFVEYLGGSTRCPDGYTCSDGACLPDSGDTCTDSDGGLNYNKPGFVVSQDGTISVDSCSGGSSLNEYSCGANGEAVTNSYTCPYGCQNRKCIQKNQIGLASGGDSFKFEKTSKCLLGILHQ